MENTRQLEKSNIVLIGMPAVGKSTVGVILAKIIGYQFVDTDLLIQANQGKRLSEIIEERGIDGFLDVENRVNAGVSVTRSVIATGGSAVYGEEAMSHLKKIGIVVYLKADYETLSNRLRNIRQRGVTLREGQTLRDLYDERTVLYEKYADLIVEEDGEIEDTVTAVLKAMA